jgi:DUF1680 family protein
VIQPVPFTAVRISDSFWSPRLEANRATTIPYAFAKCEETGRIDNFSRAAGLKEGAFEGIRFNDSDVFKVIEGAAYSLSVRPDAELDGYLDDLISKIASAQEADGYLYTTRTIDPQNVAEGAGETRWSYLQHSHELYNVGHLYEAAVAHYQATGKRTLLEVAIRNADLIDGIFGPEGIRDVPGHQEIEIGLVKLYRVTGERRYLELARFFLDERGQAQGHALYGEYAQDHRPVTQQNEAVGHAVRAGYMYSGMADVGALCGDASYVKAMERIWRNVAERKLALTGGIGARRKGEAFGSDYELPNATAYNETCAAIANVMWNHRLFLLTGDAKYADVMERTLYNGFLSGVSLSGDRFFYPNPLSSDGDYAFNQGSTTRQPWFGCSCCPTNIARFVPSIPGYAYAQDEDAVYVNMYVGSRATVVLGGASVRLSQETRYPWDGAVSISVDPEREASFAVRLRIPCWARGQPVPSDLYRYLDDGAGLAIRVNGETASNTAERGFACLSRTWKAGDCIHLDLAMPIRRTLSHPRVRENVGRVALERGPLVFCAEWADNDRAISRLVVPDGALLTAEHRGDLLGGVTVIRGSVLAAPDPDGSNLAPAQVEMTAIPYYAWSHRGPGEMAVWLLRDPA